MSLMIYLDESGDLGWSFDAPFRRGGSSRYLTIASLCLPNEKKHLPKRIIKNLYQKFGWLVAEEKKWSAMNGIERTEFAKAARSLCLTNQDIQIHAITVRKENVQQHIRADGNKLYNYMIRLSLLGVMRRHDEVHVIPDPRSIKVESGNSLADYLQTLLWMHLQCKTILKMHPVESHKSRNVQFADMLAGAVQTGFEDGNMAYHRLLLPIQKCLYF